MRVLVSWLAILILLGSVALLLETRSTSAQEDTNTGLSLSVVGIAVKHDDYQASQYFYTKVIGLQEAFSFSPTGRTTTNTYFQISRDTFLEMAEAAANAPAGFTHIHLGTDDADAVVERFQQAGGKACAETLRKGCVRGSRIAQPVNEKSAMIIDPSGVVFEPTEFISGSMTKKAINSWGSKGGTSPRLMVVGINVNDYSESQNFYEKLMGLPIAFKFSNADGTQTTTYFQISRDTYLEMQSATADAPAGITHIHIQTDDLNATIARLRQAGLASVERNATTPNAVTEPSFAQPTNVKSANVFDPSGIRLELNELVPGSFTKKAMDAAK